MSQSTSEQSPIDALCALAAHLAGASSARVVASEDEAVGAVVPLRTEGGAQVGVLDLLDAPGAASSSAHLGAVTSALVTAMEVEDLRGELFDAEERAARAEESLHEAAGQLVHDVNNPLAAASMALEIARDQIDEGLVAQLLDRASGGATRMKRMVTDLLHFSAAPAVGESSLGEVLGRIVTDFEGLPVGDVEVPDVQVQLALAPGDLEVVLVALLENSVKFAEGDPRVRVEMRPGAETVTVLVHDAGRGIPVADRDRVFAPTLRLDRQVPGMGLGLSTAARLVRSVGGRMGVSDSSLGGVAVWFEVPGTLEL